MTQEEYDQLQAVSSETAERLKRFRELDAQIRRMQDVTGAFNPVKDDSWAAIELGGRTGSLRFRVPDGMLQLFASVIESQLIPAAITMRDKI